MPESSKTQHEGPTAPMLSKTSPRIDRHHRKTTTSELRQKFHSPNSHTVKANILHSNQSHAMHRPLVESSHQAQARSPVSDVWNPQLQHRPGPKVSPTPHRQFHSVQPRKTITRASQNFHTTSYSCRFALRARCWPCRFHRAMEMLLSRLVSLQS